MDIIFIGCDFLFYQADRRKIHLGLKDSVKSMIEDIDDAKKEYEQKIFQGISKEDLEFYFKINNKILSNVLDGLEREKNE